MSLLLSVGADMDDYRDLVIAGFGLLCAALMLVAGLLFIIAREGGQANSGKDINLPSQGQPSAIFYFKYFAARSCLNSESGISGYMVVA